MVNSPIGVVYRGDCARTAARHQCKVVFEYVVSNARTGALLLVRPGIYSVLPIPGRISGIYKLIDRLCVTGLTFTTCSGDEMRFGPFLVIALLLLIVWAGGFLMFHLASGLIHLLLLFAVISFVAHLILSTREA